MKSYEMYKSEEQNPPPEKAYKKNLSGLRETFMVLLMQSNEALRWMEEELWDNRLCRYNVHLVQVRRGVHEKGGITYEISDSG